MITPEKIYSLRQEIALRRPLVNCIANHVTAGYCANAVLAVGARPIMAEFEKESVGIVSAAKALSVNLGGINDSKAAAISVSAKTAHDLSVPWIIDLVGIGCSSFRLELANELIQKYSPDVIKGNRSEIFALCGIASHAEGVDSSDGTDISVCTKMAEKAASAYSAVVMMTGETDIITDGNKTVYVKNGDSLMTYVTGTGCVLGALTGCFLTAANAFDSAVSATVTMGIAGEQAAEIFRKDKSISRFAGSIIDGLFSADIDIYINKARYYENEA